MIRSALIFVGLAAAALLAVPAAADNGNAQDPKGTTQILEQLRSLFKAWDLNKDGYLDKEELAKAFRGKDAKPYEEKPEDKDAKKPAKDNTGLSKYPDYLFLKQADTDGDGKVSQDEFDTWAENYAIQLKQQMDAELRVLQAEARLQQKLTAAELKQLQNELKKEQAALKQMQNQARGYEKHLQQQMHHATGGRRR
jgi:Ca2+-binding EF-hand superfamily protein